MDTGALPRRNNTTARRTPSDVTRAPSPSSPVRWIALRAKVVVRTQELVSRPSASGDVVIADERVRRQSGVGCRRERHGDTELSCQF